MEIALAYSVVTLVTLGAIAFIVILNIRQSKNHVKNLDFRTVVIELITLTIWVSMLIRFIQTDSPTDALANFILFILSIVFGILLIRSSIREMKIRGSVDRLRVKQADINKRLRKLDQEKTDFLSLASHQLRGPLSSINGYASMIAEGEFGKLPKHLEDPVHKIIQSGRAMNALINDFLDVTQIENNELEYEIKEVNLGDVLDSVVEDYSTAFKREDIALKSTHNKKDSVIVLADPLRVRQILNKIIDNSLKYTQIGSVTISLAIKNDDAIITIADTGIGIEAHQIKELFKKFVRADNANDATVIGSGLGLYVAKEIAESQGGRIWVESQGAGRGSKFYVALPMIKEE